MLYTVKQAYEKLNKAIGICQVRDLMASGEIPSVFQKNKWITTEEHLIRFKQRLHMQAKENSDNMKKAFNTIKKK